MTIQIKKDHLVYELPLEPIIQLCGVNFVIKRFLFNSLEKYFSFGKYAQYESVYQDNVRLDGNEVGRKYFKVVRISDREQLIRAIKLSKTSIMSEYLTACYSEFESQKILEQIDGLLEQLYLQINTELFEHIGNIQLGYEAQDILNIIQKSEVMAKEEAFVECMSNAELLETYIGLIIELQKKRPQKLMVLIEDIDHLLELNEYKIFMEQLQNTVAEFDMTFLLSMSIEGYVYLQNSILEGVCVVNDILFSFPEMEHLKAFIQQNYPRQIQMTDGEIFSCIQGIIHKIGKNRISISLQDNVILKMIQNSLCMGTDFKNGLNSLEKAFLECKNGL